MKTQTVEKYSELQYLRINHPKEVKRMEKRLSNIVSYYEYLMLHDLLTGKEIKDKKLAQYVADWAGLTPA
jgi:hypothetical protein